MAENENTNQSNREFALHRIYLKDLSFETPNAPEIFQTNAGLESNLSVNTQARRLNEALFEVTLTVTVTTKAGDKTAYLVEVQQGGVFGIQGFPEEEMGPMLGIYCPNVLFPFAREAVADLVSKGSFPQLVLQPINFELLYAQHQQQAGQGGARAPEETH